jgi:hypothetical protein
VQFVGAVAGFPFGLRLEEMRTAMPTSNEDLDPKDQPSFPDSEDQPSFPDSEDQPSFPDSEDQPSFSDPEQTPSRKKE